MAKIPGTAVASGIVPSDDRSALPTHYAEYGKGGLRRVATIAALNNIPVERREYGMLVFVDAVESFYQVGPAPAYAFGAAPFVPGPGTDTIYASTSAGLAAVSEGEYFYVADADGLHLYRDVAGAATAIGDFPTTAVLAAQVSAAQTAANDADAAKTAAETAQGLAEAAQEGAAVSEAAASSSATAAASSATTASGHATQAGVYRDQARAAADASSPQYFFDTYAAAEAALSSIPDDAVVEVWEDETHSDYRTRYLKEPGNLVFKVQFESDSLKTDLQTTGSDKGADIPYFLPYGSVKQVRSVQAKLRETISFADKGAIPNDSSLAAKNTNTAAINAAFADALATGAIVVSDNKEYHVNGTISPKSAFTWQSFDTTITFDPSGTYTEIEDNVGAGSGKYVAFDTLGCNNLNHFGALTLKSASPSSMTHANRQSINANLIAMSCSTAATPSTGTGDGSEASWGNVAISGFGGAFYQADQTGGVANILPYTRTHFRLLKIQFCINPIVSGANGAG
ncbi:MAG TPA: hypothetical protein DDW98_08745, partial [Gammaproteobacteria bacterium]|nr:hypothetical protein [Gammaproteobacteria bacterium]